METNSVWKQGFPIWEYLRHPAHSRTGTPHMEMGSVHLKTSKSRVEEHLTPNFGWEIEIFPLSFLYWDLRIEMGPCSQTRTIQSLTWFQIEFVPHCHMERGNPCFHTGSLMTRLPVSIWWLPYGNGNIHAYGIQKDWLPVSIQGSPYRNRSPFLNGNSSVTNPFPNRVCAHLGIEVKITIWECFLYGDRCFHMGITVWNWAGWLGIWGLIYILLENIQI